MNFPRYIWNDNVKCDLCEFITVANQVKSSGYCNEEEYNSLKQLFPLSSEVKGFLLAYKTNEEVVIDVTQDDAENQEQEIKSQIITSCDNKNICDNVIEMIKDSLCTEKSVPRSLLNDLQELNKIHLEKGFLFLSKELTLEDAINLWDSLNRNNFNNDSVIECYICFILLPRAKQEYIYEICEIFMKLCRDYGPVLKSVLVKMFTQKNIQEQESSVLVQYFSSMDNDCKENILKHILYSVNTLRPNHIPIVEAFLNAQLDVDILSKLIDVMASSSEEFCDDNAYGKLLFKTVNLLDRNVTRLEKPLKHILGLHRSIWKIKVEKIVFKWFNDNLTQSFF